tara:strand:- start:21 stop:713 length:693 start_codon:yes stop_codon:yes gene_type:complete
MTNIKQHYDYYDLKGRNYNFYTEKQMELAALKRLNEGGTLTNNKEYFEKDPFISFEDKYHPFDAYNSEYLLEIKRTDKNRNDLYTFGYDLSPDKMERMRDYWWRHSDKQILVLLMCGVREWDRDTDGILLRHRMIETYMKTDCKGFLFPIPIKKNNYLESITRYPTGTLGCGSYGNAYTIFDYHDTEAFPGPISDWFDEHFKGKEAQKWFKEPFGTEKEKLKEKGEVDDN